MVRLPVSEASWSTWKRYCDALGISMGRAIVALVEHELRSVVGEVEYESAFLDQIQSGVEDRQAVLDARERSLEVREEALRERERRIRASREPLPRRAAVAKVGRNDPCPCGSGLKLKRCHGV